MWQVGLPVQCGDGLISGVSDGMGGGHGAVRWFPGYREQNLTRLVVVNNRISPMISGWGS